MAETVCEKIVELSGADLRRAYRERRDFQADRVWPGRIGNGIYYMSHFGGFVMVREYGVDKFPFVLTEADWRGLAPISEPSDEPR